MGAAGYVTIYEEAGVREAYAELWGGLEHTIETDWTYPTWEGTLGSWLNVRVSLNGVWYLVDYSDDQGNHEGVNNPFWFSVGVPLIETGEAWPNGNPKMMSDPVELARQWAEIDYRVPLADQTWNTQPQNRTGGKFNGTYPSQARVLLALQKVDGHRTEVWT